MTPNCLQINKKKGLTCLQKASQGLSEPPKNSRIAHINRPPKKKRFRITHINRSVCVLCVCVCMCVCVCVCVCVYHMNEIQRTFHTELLLLSRCTFTLRRLLYFPLFPSLFALKSSNIRRNIHLYTHTHIYIPIYRERR